MNKRQAMAMLQFIAELYIVMNAPDEPDEPASTMNGHGQVRETQPVTID